MNISPNQNPLGKNYLNTLFSSALISVSCLISNPIPIYAQSPRESQNGPNHYREYTISKEKTPRSLGNIVNNISTDSKEIGTNLLDLVTLSQFSPSSKTWRNDDFKRVGDSWVSGFSGLKNGALGIAKTAYSGLDTLTFNALPDWNQDYSKRNWISRPLSMASGTLGYTLEGVEYIGNGLTGNLLNNITGPAFNLKNNAIEFANDSVFIPVNLVTDGISLTTTNQNKKEIIQRISDYSLRVPARVGANVLKSEPFSDNMQNNYDKALNQKGGFGLTVENLVGWGAFGYGFHRASSKDNSSGPHNPHNNSKASYWFDSSVGGK